MTNDKLIARLANELYDLKQKLEDVRRYADEIYYSSGISSVARMNSIEILNLIDSGEVYEE